MKKIIYSNWTKFIIACLIVLSIVIGSITVVNALAEYRDEKEKLYNFESVFSDTRIFSYLFDGTEYALIEAYKDSLKTVDDGIPDQETIEENFKKKLSTLQYADKINYYIKWNDMVFTNCGASDEKELISQQFYRVVVRNENGSVDIDSSDQRYYSYTWLDELHLLDTTASIVVCTSVRDTYVNECRETWTRQAAIVRETFFIVVICVLLALVLLVYLLCVCGKNKDGEYLTTWIDHIWVEVHLLLTTAITFGAIFVFALLLDEYLTGYFPYYLTVTAVILSVVVASASVLTALLSIVRNIKRKRFVESSIIARVVKWGIRTVLHVLKLIFIKSIRCGKVLFQLLTRKTGIIFIALLFVYTFLIGLFGIFVDELSTVWFLLGVLLFCVASIFVAFRAKELDEIKKGISELRKGNASYQINELMCDDMKHLATDINDIAKGVDESVTAKMKAERLKTDLITNVSHDLKTPITSIITYAELLSKVEDLPEEAKDYVSVISKKSERLKKLTQDLFDISKVQSGNEAVIWEKLDVGLLIDQAMGEYDKEISESGLTFCVDTSKDLWISADGRKVSRVVSNLINNALKYSLKNTRVFVSAWQKDEEVMIELKNIASYPMNFSADEIVRRFVRGDESRTSNGNGLGLAIAKSFTEVCGGSFEVVIDGDMFKVILKFPRYR